MTDEQRALILKQFKTLKERSSFYAQKFREVDLGDVQTQADFERLPFSEKDDLRNAYPLGLSAVPEDDIVRIHSSSGTTGTPVIIPYTAQDVEDWAVMFARCYEMAGITKHDRIHITPGYGLWTAGIGFQAGAERLGAMAIPLGPGNTEKQLQMMRDLKSTVLTATSSYALLLAETIAEKGIRDTLSLRKACIGSERWGEKMRARIASELGVELYDIYGLTEIYGPGIGISCDEHAGMHYWSDYLYCEIVDPKTGAVLPDGEIGELVITTLRKQGAPLIRYRTHDLTRIIAGDCACGSPFPRIDILIGRTDDMVKVKGVNMFPAQIEEVIKFTDGASSEYQVMIDHLNGKDILTLFFETGAIGEEKKRVEEELALIFKGKIGMTPVAKGVPLGDLPRSEKKTQRIFDNRY
ncbi:MAG: phenylacetate--CoA ligase [Coriobacteriaceae bacterium]|jgi:phenylacetate-CoA ligase|nr:phenylacetate--CoA ligase [Coriobacteriaceae bacterium]